MSLIPELSESAVSQLEVGIYNATIRGERAAGLDPVWTTVVEGAYRRRAADIAANLTREPGIWNGNPGLLDKLLAGTIAPRDVASLTPREMRPELFEGGSDDAVSRATDSNVAAVSTMFECPKCSAFRCTFVELQTRCGDEGSTLFLNCLECGTDWTTG